jgi:hypothetical protein
MGVLLDPKEGYLSLLGATHFCVLFWNFSHEIKKLASNINIHAVTMVKHRNLGILIHM